MAEFGAQGLDSPCGEAGDGRAPYPPRFRWLRRTLLIALAVPAAAGLLRWGAGVRAQQLFTARLAEARAAAEAAAQAPNKAAHAWLRFRAAAEARVENLDEWYLRDGDVFLRRVEGYWYGPTPAEADRLLRANAAALELAREACASPTEAPPEEPGTWPEEARGIRDVAGLARVCSACAVLHAVRGEHAAALARLREALQIGRAANAAAMRWQARAGLPAIESALAYIAPDLRIGADGAARADVEALVAELLSVSLAGDVHAALAAERRRALENIAGLCVSGMAQAGVRAPGAGSWTQPVWLERLICKPLWQMQGVEIFERMSRQIAAGAASSADEAERLWPAAPRRDTLLAQFSRFEDRLVARSLDKLPPARFEREAACRLAAARLALQLYEADHGELPPTLAALVPAYLPAVPTDPYSADGRPIAYERARVEPVIHAEMTGGHEWYDEEWLDEHVRSILTTGRRIERPPVRPGPRVGAPPPVPLVLTTWLAVRLYEADHGARPEGMRVLIPNYLVQFWLGGGSPLPARYDGRVAAGWLAAGPFDDHTAWLGYLERFKVGVPLGWRTPPRTAPTTERAPAKLDPRVPLAIVRLGLRLHEVDNGALPESLDPLVGVYLPGLPDDPLAPAPRPVEYVAHGPDAGLYVGTGAALHRYEWAELDRFILDVIGGPAPAE